MKQKEKKKSGCLNHKYIYVALRIKVPILMRQRKKGIKQIVRIQSQDHFIVDVPIYHTSPYENILVRIRE